MIVCFDMLYNKDYAVLKTLQENYYDARYMRDFSTQSIEDYEVMITNRNERNPLYVCLFNDYLDSADSLYQELLQDDKLYHNLILAEKIASLCYMSQKSSVVELTVLCKNKLEQEIVKNMFGYNTILEEELSTIEFDSMVINYKEDIIKWQDLLSVKTVYLAQTKYNLILYPDGNYNITEELFELVLIKRINIKIISMFDYADNNIIN